MLSENEWPMSHKKYRKSILVPRNSRFSNFVKRFYLSIKSLKLIHGKTVITYRTS